MPKYTVENPPKNWENYPDSFLKAAIPILNKRDGNFSLANRDIERIGLRSALDSKSCPVIDILSAIRISGATEITYEISGNPNKEYFISISIYSGDKFIRTIQMGTQQLRAVTRITTDEDITRVRLNASLVGIDDVATNKTISVSAQQPELTME